ncbi:MAG: S1C family serine protease [Bacteroidales bacterium]
MRKILITLLAFFVIVTSFAAEVGKGGGRDTLQLERLVKSGIQRAYAASVRIWGFDTVRNVQNGSQFSGVVVSDEGHILTVAHAVQPGRSYKVRFPDGKEVIALSLGRIGFSNQDNRPDLAMIKIRDKGSWPVAEMGWSHSLKVNEPCISISYPTTLNQMKPSVRFGRIADVLNNWGFVQSTCKMEPGDSGGPLFDYMGRVVAMHSRCGRHEDENYEVPVDLYRKYWNALNIAEDYKSLPQEVTEPGSDSLAASLFASASLEKPGFSLPELDEKLSATVVAIKSSMNGKQTNAVGTLIRIKSKHYIISKSSLTGTDVLITAQGKSMGATPVGRDEENDLVVLRPEGKLKGGLTKEDLQKSDDSVRLGNLGGFLISPLPSGRKVSIISTEEMNLLKLFSSGYFGASAQFREGKIILNRIAPKSPADSVKLKIGDQITGINGKPISRPEEYGGELRRYNPGDSISVECIRADSVFSAKVLLTARPKGNHAADKFEGGKSVRADGFNGVFAHDSNIKADECGGPVFDTNGNFVGINIARFSRTTTLTLPRFLGVLSKFGIF